MKVLKLIAENVKKIKAVMIKSENQNLIKITGANEQGKTTVLDCIWWALGGSKNIQEKPIRDGQDKARIQLDLGDIIVTRTFTAKDSYLEVTNRDGASYKSPQAILDKLIGDLSFDPLKFAKAKKDEKVSMLLKVVDLNVDYDRLDSIVGGKAARNENPIASINETYRQVFESRTMVNRDVDRAKKVLSAFEGIEKTDPVVVSELVKERDEKVKKNQQNDTEVKLIATYQKEADEYSLRLSEIDSAITEAERQLETLRKRKEELALTHKEALNVVAEQSAYCEKLVYEDLTEINQKIAEADKTNFLAQKWYDKCKITEELSRYERQSEEHSEMLEAIKAYKEELVKAAEFPIDGLGFENGGVTLNGIPVEQCSSAQQLKVSVAIAMALNPKLKIIRIDDGSLLDSKSMAIIEEMAKDNDYQVWMEVVDESGKAGIYIEDGEIINNNYEETVSN